MRNDLEIYDRCAASWWDPTSRFAASLHGLNVLRLAHLADELGDDLHGIDVVDLGCGGGLLAEPLARRGANVIGIDRSESSLAVARAHGQGVAGLRYELGDLGSPALPAASADLVCCADVLEHVDDWQAALVAAARLLRPGGRLYVSTMNRTWQSRWIGVYLAEGLGIIPAGTHDPARFIRPTELISAAAAAGLGQPRLLGERLRLWATIRHWAVRMSPGKGMTIGYGAWFTRETPA